MTDYKYDRVAQVRIGYDSTAAGHVVIENVVSFAERVVSPDGDLVDPLTMINSWNPGGVHQNQKYWELELVLDTNWYPNSANPEQYWAYYQDVDGAAGVAIDEDGPNANILYFVVYVREHDGTYVRLVYTRSAPQDYGATNVLWCTGETSEISNETGERHQTVTFKFICLKERHRYATAAPTAAVAPEGSGKIKRINHVQEGGTSSVNIIRFKEDFVMRMTPQFVPNRYQGVGLKQDEKYRVITVTVDSETDIFDSMLEITAANDPAVTDFLVQFQLDDTAGTTETWTYEPSKTYLVNRREGEIGNTSERSTFEIEFISYGTKAVSQP